MIKPLFLAVNILANTFGFISPLSTVDSVESTEVADFKSRNQRYEVVEIVAGDGAYLENEKGETVYLVEDDFSSGLAIGEEIVIIFDKDGDIVEIMEEESEYFQYEVVSIGDGVYLEGEGDNVYLIIDDFTSTLSVGDVINISFDKEGDIEDIIEDVKKVAIF